MYIYTLTAYMYNLQFAKPVQIIQSLDACNVIILQVQVCEVPTGTQAHESGDVIVIEVEH